jgi:hypothetical protein
MDKTFEILETIHRPVFYLKHNVRGDWILSASLGCSFSVWRSQHSYSLKTEKESCPETLFLNKSQDEG